MMDSNRSGQNNEILADENGGRNTEGPVDFQGNPVNMSKTGGWLGAGLILGVELSERICVMGISMNLVTYLTGVLHLASPQSANIVNNFMGTLNLLGLVGGFLADAKFGRYLTTAFSAAIVASGVTLLTLSTIIPGMRPPPCQDSRGDGCIQANEGQLAILYASLYITAIGAGGIKSNVSGFGSDQFDTSNPREEKAMIYFFNRFYFCISLGSLFAVTILIYTQDNVGRGYGYGIAAGTMVIALIVLLSGSRRYRYVKPKGSPFTVIWSVISSAWRNRKLSPDEPAMLNGYSSAQVAHTKALRCLDKAAIIDDRRADESLGNHAISTVTQVEEVKMVIQLIPIWSTCILFWTVYSQMNTFTIEQATFMDRHLGSFPIPAGSFAFFLFVTILIFTSLNDRVLVPIARKFTNNTQGITSLQRIGIGLVFSIAGMVASALVETMRRERAVKHNDIVTAFWLVPQFFLVGAGEAFAYVGQLEFFIREAPEQMKSMSTGLFLSTLSMGYFVSSLLVSLVGRVTHEKWLRSDYNKGKLDYFYWMLAILGVLNYLVFVAFAMRHQYKSQSYVPREGATEEEEVRRREQIEKTRSHNLELELVAIAAELD